MDVTVLLCLLTPCKSLLCKSGFTLSLQVAMVQFTDDPRTEFKLDSYKTKETLLDAIRHISYKGGNTKTGKTQTDIDKTMPSEI